MLDTSLLSYLIVSTLELHDGSTIARVVGPAPSIDEAMERDYAQRAPLGSVQARAFLFAYGDGGPVRAVQEWEAAHGWQALTSTPTYDDDFVSAQLQLSVECSRLGDWADNTPRELIHAAGDALNSTWVEGITVAAWVARGRAALLGQ